MNNNNLTKIERMRIATRIVDDFNSEEFCSFILSQETSNKKKEVVQEFLSELIINVSYLLLNELKEKRFKSDEIIGEIKKTLTEISQFLFVKISDHQSKIKDKLFAELKLDKKLNLISQSSFENYFSKYLKSKKFDDEFYNIFPKSKIIDKKNISQHEDLNNNENLNNEFYEVFPKYKKLTKNKISEYESSNLKEEKIKELVLFKKRIRSIQGDILYEVIGLKELLKEYGSDLYKNEDYYRYNPKGNEYDKIKVNISDLIKQYRTDDDYFLGFKKQFILDKTFEFYNIDENYEQSTEQHSNEVKLSKKLIKKETKMYNLLDKKTPFYKYVLAWFSFNICYNLFSYFFIFLLIKSKVKFDFYSNEITVYSFLIPFISALSMGIAFILIFNFFKNLNLKKIIPYIWVINGLLYLSSLGNEIGTVKNIHGGVVILYILGFLGGMLIIHSYYQKNYERWY